MRHWTVSLLRDGHTSRQWHVWSDVLTVGSHGAAKVRLPLPVEPWALRLSELPEATDFQVGEFLLRIQDTTTERANLWERAQVRMENVSRQPDTLRWPDLHPTPWGTAVLALCLAGLTHWTAEQFASTPAQDQDASRQSVQQLAPAPSFSQPAAPFAPPPLQTLTLGIPTSGNDGIGRGTAPTRVGTSIVVKSTSHAPSGSSSGSSDLAKDLAAPAQPLVHSVVSAPWPAADSRSWESLDQPPPEPPH